MKFKVGDRVEIHGMKEYASLNGKCGTVSLLPKGYGHEIVVDLDVPTIDSGKLKLFHVDNLRSVS